MSRITENKFDTVLSKLADNESLFQRLIEAVADEKSAAEEKMKNSAVEALFHREQVSQACGLAGAYNVWQDIMTRLLRAQHE